MAAGQVTDKTAAVIGNGFGGLAAIRLQSAGVQTVLYEAKISRVAGHIPIK